MAEEPNEKADGDSPDLIVEKASLAMETFLKDNPPSRIEKSSMVNEALVVEPWGDDFLAFRIGTDYGALASALNSVRLPHRLSAIYHKANKDLEVIWTAFQLSKSQVEIKDRKFSFKYKSRKYLCEFGLASEVLGVLSEHFLPLMNRPTDFRNLMSHSAINFERRHGGKSGQFDVSRSFWIRNIEWNEERIIDVVNNLNFYLTYYDPLSPQILLHDPKDVNEKSMERTRYLHGKFPKDIHAKSLDPTLLSFWQSADKADPMMRFLLYFRIIEYSGTSYLDGVAKTSIKKLLNSPNLRSSIPEAIDQIVSTISSSKLDDIQKFKSVIKNCVEPKLLWRDIKENIAIFSKETRFDGGFTVRPLVSGEHTESSFCANGLDNFCELVRKIRNALSHGKDQETAGVITPSTRNLKLFQPWVHLIAIAAGEVVLYRDTT